MTEVGAFSIISAYLRLVAQGEKIAGFRADCLQMAGPGKAGGRDGNCAGDGRGRVVLGLVRRELHLHCFGAFNAQPGQHDDQLAESDGGGCEQECFARGVLFGEDVMAMVEVVELLR